MHIERRVGALVALGFFVQVTSGCLSNEYRIPKDELQRLAQAPVEQRGQRVHVVQDVGQRDGDAIEPPPPPPEDPYVDDVQIDVRGSGSGSGTAGGGAHGAPSGGAWRRPTPSGGAMRGMPPGGTMRGTPPGAGFRGSPPGGGSFRGSPPVRGGGGGGFRLPSGGGGGGGGGGGNGADALAVLAVVLVLVAVVAAVALVGSEGMRFDGYVEMAPDQPLHLKDESGAIRTVSVATLTVDDAAQSAEATVLDDEGFGLRRLDRAPLDRTGMAFKLEMGSSTFNLGLKQIAGMASQIQVGAFVTQKVGIMLDIGVSGGAVCCDGFLSRHSLALETQLFPVALGRLHLGLFGKGGVAIAGGGADYQSGPIVGGGALVELALTTRLALTFRAGANAAKLDDGWSSAGTLTGGIAVY
jgi:hypothetical protein